MATTDDDAESLDLAATASGGSSVSGPSAVDLCVIIAARDAAATIRDQLDALVCQSWDGGTWEVVVADNGSTDETRAIVERFAADHARVLLVDASAEPGAGPARNEAMRQSPARAFAFCDADDVVEPGWVAAMGAALGRDRFVAGRLAFDRLNPEWSRTAFYSKPPEQLETFDGIFPIAATANLGVTSEVIDTVGGFDGSFRTGQDLELCLRMWTAGIDLVFVPDAVVQYRYRPTMRSLFRRSREYGAVGPRIARRLAAAGAATPRRLAGLRNWLWLLRHIGKLRTLDGRARWVVVLGRHLGRIQGSVRERWLYL